ncbi:MAG: hypothetical protein KDF67_04975, partial [Ottowia sp.]|nr:hypothetical protein [Ottowia sp.]
MRLKSLCLSAGLALAVPVFAADTLESCSVQKNDTLRLACYDRLAGRVQPASDALSMEQSGPPAHLRVSARESRGSTLSERWELA